MITGKAEKPSERVIVVTLRMDDKHDERAVRRLLKQLKRAYGLECVGLCEKGQRAEG